MAKGKDVGMFKDDVDAEDRLWNNVHWNGMYLHQEREACVDRHDGRDKDLLEWAHYYRSLGGMRQPDFLISEKRHDYISDIERKQH